MSPDTTDDPDALFEHLCAFADPRRIAQLKMFRRLCREHHARGSLDFRSVTIATLAERESNYAYSSLRSASGRPYRQYIAAFARSVGGYTHRPDARPAWRSTASTACPGRIDPDEPMQTSVLAACETRAHRVGGAPGSLSLTPPDTFSCESFAPPSASEGSPVAALSDDAGPLELPEPVSPDTIKALRLLLRVVERKLIAVLPDGDSDAEELFA